MKKIAYVVLSLLLAFWVAPLAHAQLTLTGAGKGAPPAAAWTPTSLGVNLVAWWDISQPVYTDTGCSSVASNGNNIDCVPDQSGNGYTPQTISLLRQRSTRRG
jgi:hypothetical protein